MRITTEKSIKIKVEAYLKSLTKKTNWGEDNYICVRPAGERKDKNEVTHYTEVELVTYSSDCFMSGDAIIYFKQINMGKDRYIVFYEDWEDYSSVIDLEDVRNILVNKIQNLFDEWVFDKTVICHED